MLVVDFMHEVELGVWKSLFTHLIRILYAISPTGELVDTLDRRYGTSSIAVQHYNHGTKS